MRPLEIALVLGEWLTFLALQIPRVGSVRWNRFLPLAVLLLAAAQTLIEGARWQMFPAYVLSGLLALAFLLSGARRSEAVGHARLRRLVTRLSTALGALALAMSAALPIAFPVFKFPPPHGPYGIGTLTYDWVDTARPEIFTADPSDRRELMVQIWYPAQSDTSGKRAPYVEDGLALAPLARLLRLPGFVVQHLKYVMTDAIPAASVAAGVASYPLLVLSHGRGGFRQENTWQVEELVSHGYVVAAIDHTYAAAGVVFSDGRRVSLDPRMLVRKTEDSYIPYLAQDVSFTLDQLATINRSDPKGVLTGRLDLQRVGMFGLSLGGEITAEACRLDPRLKACLIMDVWMPADVVKSGLLQPTMWITRDARTMGLEGWSPEVTDETLGTMRKVYDGLPGDGYFVRVPGMFHGDFSDAPLFSPFTRWLGISGPMNARRGFAIVSAYELAFFDRHLKGTLEELLDGPAKAFPEVHFETRRLGPANTITKLKQIAELHVGRAVDYSQSMALTKIISGGQTGVDRGALDAALVAGFTCGGWCPAHRGAEDGEIPERYPLKSLPDTFAGEESSILTARQVGEQYRARTLKNVQASDGTVILFSGTLSGGTLLTQKLCVREKKPFITVDAKAMTKLRAAETIAHFVEENQIQVLNVAGPRLSGWPQGYTFALGVIGAVISHL